MPRGPRLDAPGVVHPITLRGIGRRDLLFDDADREFFCSRLDSGVLELGFGCLASALVPNHVHVILRSGRVRISRLMASVCTSYALYFAKRHGWTGHVFQNRLGASRIVDDAWLIAAIAYVHRNPVDAGVVSLEQLATYPWTTHSTALGMRPPRPFESVRETLEPRGGDAQRLIEAVARGGPLAADLRWRKLPPRPVVPARRCRRPHGLSRERLLSRERSRAVPAARRSVAVRATRELLTQAEVARRLRITSAAVTQLIARDRRSGPSSRLLKQRPRVFFFPRFLEPVLIPEWPPLPPRSSRRRGSRCRS